MFLVTSKTTVQSDDKSPNEIDKQLLTAIASGDKDAFERFYRRYFKKVVGFALRTTANNETAEDVAVDTMMVVWRTAKNFGDRSKVSTWVFGIAYRVALKARAKNKTDVDDNVELEELPHGSTGMDELERVFLRDQLGRALQSLSIEQRSVIELTYYYGCTYPEIGEIMGCPVGTVKTRMLHARSNMKHILSTQSRR